MWGGKKAPRPRDETGRGRTARPREEAGRGRVGKSGEAERGAGAAKSAEAERGAGVGKSGNRRDIEVAVSGMRGLQQHRRRADTRAKCRSGSPS